MDEVAAQTLAQSVHTSCRLVARERGRLPLWVLQGRSLVQRTNSRRVLSTSFPTVVVTAP